jgi:hypothetical protein
VRNAAKRLLVRKAGNLCAGPDADNRSLASNTGSPLKRGQSHGGCSLHSAGDLPWV